MNDEGIRMNDKGMRDTYDEGIRRIVIVQGILRHVDIFCTVHGVPK